MNECRVGLLVENLKDKPLGRPRSRWATKVNQSHYRPEVPRGFQEVKVPRLRDNDPRSRWNDIKMGLKDT